MASELNIIDENGNIIGKASRKEIHEKGLLRREVRVWFYTPKGEIIFQHRAKNTDTCPDLLAASVAGHVEIGQTFESAALAEVKEETGLSLNLSDLNFVRFERNNFHDDVTNKDNNIIRAVYAYRYDGEVENLRVENLAQGFEKWPIEKLLNLSEQEKKRFVSLVISEESLGMLRKLCYGN